MYIPRYLVCLTGYILCPFILKLRFLGMLLTFGQHKMISVLPALREILFVLSH